ncbi:MAG: hypothetical protein Q8P70_02025 [bacterium]|nr:hypothetical protein [bacterium]
MSRPLLIFLALGSIILLLILVFVFAQPRDSDEFQGPIPGGIYDIVDEEAMLILQQEMAVTNFLFDELPYSGSFFHAIYDISGGRLVLTLSPEKESEGMEEFRTFLRSHDIEFEWIENSLVVQ